MTRSSLVLRGDWEYVCRRVHERAKEMNERYGIKPTLRSLFYWAADSEGLIVHSQRAYTKLSEKYARYREKVGEIDILSDRTREYKRFYTSDAIDIEEWLKWELKYIVERINDIWKLPRWYNQENYVAIWIEKETIALIERIAVEYKVDAFPSRGFASVTKLYEATKILKEIVSKGKVPQVLVITDFDPSGIFIERDYRKKIEEYGASANMYRVAVNPDQILKYNIPAIPHDDPRAVRIKRDPRYHSWLKYCNSIGVKPLVVEVDAFAGTSPRAFRELIVSWIEKFYNKSREDLKRREEEKRRKVAEEFKRKLTSMLSSLTV